jgi:hypothetical protein
VTALNADNDAYAQRRTVTNATSPHRENALMLFGMLPPTTSRHATRPHQHSTPRAKLNRCLAQCNGDKECKLSCKCLDACFHCRAPNIQRPPSLDSATSDDITARDLTVCDRCIIDITRCERHCDGDPGCEARCECGRGNCPQCPWFKTKCPKPSTCDESSPPIDPCTVCRSKISMCEQYCRGDKVCEADCKCNIDSCKHCPSIPMACPKVEARDDALKTDASYHKCILTIAICVSLQGRPRMRDRLPVQEQGMRAMHIDPHGLRQGRSPRRRSDHIESYSQQMHLRHINLCVQLQGRPTMREGLPV